ncbi:hypothetical protein F183_A18990 [Bryobacterales bacterium F-183]|nr:hypothetical protein F183_A18990 [Bryobacterales bacterium F-183]
MGLCALLLVLLPLQDVLTVSGAPRKLSSYTFATNATPHAGTYKAEVSGARLELTISEMSGKPGVFLVSRSYYRPGQTLLRKSYIRVERASDGHWQGRGGLQLRLLQDPKLGVVVQETSSGVEALPSGMWIQYAPK